MSQTLDQEFEKILSLVYNKYGKLLHVWQKLRVLPDRNKPCVCGSGFKFKACCGSLRNQNIQRTLAKTLMSNFKEFTLKEEMKDQRIDFAFLDEGQVYGYSKTNELYKWEKNQWERIE